jgi:hypothetical protein
MQDKYLKHPHSIMNDNYTRDNRIKRMDLEIKLNAFYLPSMGVLVSVDFALIQLEFDLLTKVIAVLCLLCAAIGLGYDFIKKKYEIGELFEEQGNF